MKNLKLDPVKIQAELKAHHDSLQQGLETLQHLHTEPPAPARRTGKVIFQQDKVKLLRFRSSNPQSGTTPILICYSLINRWYMIDIQAERSLLQCLLTGGRDIYVIDWGYPDNSDRFLDLDDYVNDYLDSALDATCADAGVAAVNLLGICQGGTLSLCYSAIRPQKVKNLITMVTPVDFHTPSDRLSFLARDLDTDLAVALYGNIPGKLLNQAYNALLPMRFGVQKYLKLPDKLQQQEQARAFLRMEHWVCDSPDQAGEAFREFVSWFFQQNGLIQDQITLGGHPVRLAAIKHPVLNIFGTQDHLVPPPASNALQRYIASNDYQTLAVPAGHIGVFVSSKTGQQVALAINHWLDNRP